MWFLYLIFMLGIALAAKDQMGVEMRQIWILVTFSVAAITSGLEKRPKEKAEDEEGDE